MNRRTIIIIAASVVGVCLCLCIALVGIASIGGIGAFAGTQPIADQGERFMQSLKTGDYAGAYALCHPALQQKLGSAQGLQRLIENGKAKPSSWNFSSRNLENNQGHLEGTVTMVGGEGTVTLDLAKSGNDWKVIAFDLKPN
jgi:hypothetical protein